MSSSCSMSTSGSLTTSGSMSSQPSSPQSSSKGQRTLRVLPTQACDACRIRKRRCGHEGYALSPRSPQAERQGARQCQRCATLNLACTYLLPAGTRGPRRKTRDPLGTDSAETVNAETREDQLYGPQQSNLRPAPQELSLNSRPYATDILCDRKVLRTMLGDYLEYLYPLIPVVHRPSFRMGLAQDRDLYDDDFLCVVVALCAATVGTMPSKFREYCAAEPAIRFKSRTEMINCCYEIIIGHRGPNYFDEINYSKWAVSYLMQISFFQIGQHNRARMVEVEGMQLARLLDLHQISMYAGLNCIETQLRKKGFWLMFYAYIHSQLQSWRKERLSYLDEALLGSINLEDLLPLEIDDEMILEDTVLPQPADRISVTTGFNVHSRVFWAALKSTQSSPSSPEYCNCVRSKDSSLHLQHLQARLQELKYILDGVSTPLSQWDTSLNATALEVSDAADWRILNGQFASMRANLHVTHLWLQSIILDQIDAIVVSDNPNISSPSSIATSPNDSKGTWAEREDICRQLLHILHGIPENYIEPNGHHLTFKVRDVAVTLLACPFEPHEQVAKRAQRYLSEFTNKLSRLDGSETMNTLSLQSWVDTDRTTGSLTGLGFW